jgi:hypothetical protein
MKKFLVRVLTAALVLGAAGLFMACEGGFVDPGHIESFNGGGFYGGGGGGGGNDNQGGDNDEKPAALSENATFDQVIAKLDEIIGYSGASSSVKSLAEAYKKILQDDKSGYEANWSIRRPAVIATVNGYIILL